MLFANNLISLETLVPFAVFGGIAAAAWWVMDMVGSGKPRTMERLDEFKNPVSRRGENGVSKLTKKPYRMSKVLATAAPKLAKPLTPKSDLEKSNLKALGNKQKKKSKKDSGYLKNTKKNYNKEQKKEKDN